MKILNETANGRQNAMVDEVELLQHTVFSDDLFLNNANEQLITLTQIRKWCLQLCSGCH